MLLGTFSAHRDMLCRVRTENGAVPGPGARQELSTGPKFPEQPLLRFFTDDEK